MEKENQLENLKKDVNKMKKSELRKLIRQSILESYLQEREKVGGKYSGCSHPDKVCTKDTDCKGTYQGHCCQNGCCAQCVTYEKPPRKDPHKSLEEQPSQGYCIDPCANNYDFSAGPITCNGINFGENPFFNIDDINWYNWGPQSGTPEWIQMSCIVPFENFGGQAPPLPQSPQYFSCCTYDEGVRQDLQPGDPKPNTNDPVSPVRPGKPQTSPVRKPKPTRPSTSPANRPPKPPTSPVGSNPTKGKSGCTDSNACNYLASAVIDDGSCEYCHMNDCIMYPPNEYDCNGMPTM